MLEVIPVHQNVSGLDIAVHHFAAMNIFKSSKQLIGKILWSITGNICTYAILLAYLNVFFPQNLT